MSPFTRPSVIDYSKIKNRLDSAEGRQAIREAVVNAPFEDRLGMAKLGLGITVLLLRDKKNNAINRVALSDTEQARGAVKASAKPFKSIVVPADHRENFVARCIRTGKPLQTDDWQYLFIPGLSAEEARFNQAGAGIACSFVYPIKAYEGGAMIFSYFTGLEDKTEAHRQFMKEYAKLAAEALRRAK